MPLSEADLDEGDYLRPESLTRLSPCAFKVGLTDVLMREVPVPVFNRLVRDSAVAGLVCLDSLDPACVSRANDVIERCGCLRTEFRAYQLDRTSNPSVVANLPQECDVFLIPVRADPPRHARIIAPTSRLSLRRGSALTTFELDDRF